MGRKPYLGFDLWRFDITKLGMTSTVRRFLEQLHGLQALRDSWGLEMGPLLTTFFLE